MDEKNNQDKYSGVERLKPEENSEFKQEQVEQPQQPVPKEKKKSNWFLVVFVILAAVLVGALAYFLLLSNGHKSDACNYNGVAYNEGSVFDAQDGCNTCTCTDGAISCTYMACNGTTDTTTTTTTEETTDPYEGWKTYENTDFNVNLKYPSDWTADEQISSVDGNESLQLSITKDLYTFKLDIPFASSPSICIYSDSEETSETSIVEFESFVSLKGPDKDYRRGLRADNDLYQVCEKQGDTYVQIVGPGYVSYEIGTETVDNTMLETMDLIFLSI